MKIGYGRVSTRDQNPDAQHDALAAGCGQVFIDRASGKLARRPELDRALLVARAGDQLVVTKLDRLGRSLEHLIDLSKDLQARSVDAIYSFYAIVRLLIGGLSAEPPPKTTKTIGKDAEGNLRGYIGTGIPGTRKVNLEPLFDRPGRPSTAPSTSS